MTDSDKPMFVAALTELAALKPGAKLTPEAYAAWWNSMRGTWSLEDFRQACAKLRDDLEFMPNPFHFQKLRRASRLTAGEAWGEVREIVRAGGNCHADPLVNQAVRSLGGYRALGMTNTDQMQFLERRFCEHYESIGDAEEIREAIPQLAGPAKHISAVAQLMLTKTRAS
jgi:hypothetical protein